MRYTIVTSQEHAYQERSASEGARVTDANLCVTDETFQTIKGFGGCFNEMGRYAMETLDNDTRKSIMYDLFSDDEGCNFTFCRIPIGASDYAMEWYSHNEQDDDYAMDAFSIERDRRYILPYIQSALSIRKDVTFFASPWSPPTWMKFPKAYNYGTFRMEEKVLRAYALYFAKFVAAYEAEGVRIEQVHPQNEPISDHKFPSCVWKPEALATFMRDYLAPMMKEQGLTTEVWAGTLNTDDYNGYGNVILADDATRKAIGGVGLQWAGKGMIARINESYPDLPVIQTENECGEGDNSWEYALYVFDLLRHYLSNGAIAYVYWNMVLPPEGESTWGWKQNAMITVDRKTGEVTYNPEFYVMKHASSFIQQGAVRVGLSGMFAGNAVAFKNPDGSRVTLVANPLSYQRTLTFADGDEGVTHTLPPRSITTLIAK